MLIFYVKLVFTILSSVALWLGATAQIDWQRLVQSQRSSSTLGLLLLGFRFVPFLIVYILMDELPRGDVPFFFYKATAVQTGGLVYQDFWSYHAPLFSYLISLPLWLWNNPQAIVALMIAVESGLIVATYRHYSKYGNPANSLRNACLYLLLPAPLVMLLLGGQEDIWFWGIALWMLNYLRTPKAHGWGLGLRFSVALVAIKATFIFWLLPVLLQLKDKIRFLTSLLAVGLPTVAILYYLVGMKFLMPIQHSGLPLSPNLLSIFQPFLGLFGKVTDYTWANWLGLLLTVGTVSLLSYLVKNKPSTTILPLSFIWTFTAMTLFLPSSPGYYAFTYLLPVCFEIINWRSRRDVFILLVINALLIFQPFLFTYLNSPIYNDISTLKKPLFALEYAMQVLNVAGFGWILWRAFQKAQRI